MSYLYCEQSSPMIEQHLEKQALILLPVGTTEEHGPHLPVDTDARIADAYGHRLAEALQLEVPVLLMDTIRYGYSMKIVKQWAGTLVVRSRVFMDYVFDVCGSVLDMGFNKLAVLDCHGHHNGPLKVVSRELYDACDKAIAIISPARLSQEAYNAVRKSEQGGSIHGGEWETSLLLYLSPGLVDMEKATAEDTMRYHSEFIAGDSFMGSQRVSWSTWDIQPSKTGLYGTPSVATAETGQVIINAAVENGARFLKEYWSVQ